jgi:hypothetical protein
MRPGVEFDSENLADANRKSGTSATPGREIKAGTTSRSTMVARSCSDMPIREYGDAHDFLGVFVRLEDSQLLDVIR